MSKGGQRLAPSMSDLTADASMDGGGRQHLRGPLSRSLRAEGEAILFRKGECFVAVAPRNDRLDSSGGEQLLEIFMCACDRAFTEVLHLDWSPRLDVAFIRLPC